MKLPVIELGDSPAKKGSVFLKREGKLELILRYDLEELLKEWESAKSCKEK